MTFKPSGNLSNGTRYTVTITTGAKDLAGNAMESTYAWSFTTGSTEETSRPRGMFRTSQRRLAMVRLA
ncbi:MAG: Ig-like domain-containing protein [bacterium]